MGRCLGDDGHIADFVLQESLDALDGGQFPLLVTCLEQGHPGQLAFFTFKPQHIERLNLPTIRTTPAATIAAAKA